MVSLATRFTRTRVAALVGVAASAACDAPVARRARAPAPAADERPARVEFVVPEDDTGAARARYRRAIAASGDSPADSALADSAQWPTAVIRFGTTEQPGVTLWAGDTVHLTAPDPPAGTPDAVARDVRWSSQEPNVATVSPAGVVTAHRIGSAAIVAWRRVGQAVTPVTVLPAARGRVLVADAGPSGVREGDIPDALFTVNTDAGLMDTTRTDLEGRFTWRARGPVGRSASVYVVPVGVTAARYYPSALGRVLVEDLTRADVVLIPKRWRIESGSYAGTTVAIDAAAAVARARDGSRISRVDRTMHMGPTRRVLGWPPRRLPVPVALDFGGDGAGRRADSAAFWAAARQLERDWGAPLFEPASVDAAREAEWAGITVQIDPRVPAAGFTTTTSNGDGMIYDASVAFRTRAYARDPGIVTHELLHALGVGHTERQESVMRASGPLPPRASAEDVAYGRLVYAVRAVQARGRAVYGLAEVVDF